MLLTDVNTGDKVKAEDLITFLLITIMRYGAARYVMTQGCNPRTDDERRFGCGQPKFEYSRRSPIAATVLNMYEGSLIDATDINEITAKMNAGLYPLEDDQSNC